MTRDVRVLMSEGSSLSARQTLSALGPLGYALDVCDPRPGMCLARFSRYVRRIFRCPSFATDPAGYLQFVVARLNSERYDVLLAVHDQAYLLSRYRDDLTALTGLALPGFKAMQQMQSKAGLAAVLRELNLPQPATITCRSPDDVPADVVFPAYVKLAHSTAGCGVWRVADRHQLDETVTRVFRETEGE